MSEERTQRIIVDLSQSDAGGEAVDQNWEAPEVSQKSKPNRTTENSKSAILSSAFGFRLGKQALHATTSRIGSYTGDYMTQNRIASFTNMTMLGISLATGNPVAIAMTVASTAMSMADTFENINKGNVQANMLSSITSTSASNRSRGTGGKI